MQDVFSLTHLDNQDNSLPNEIAGHILTKIFTGQLMQGSRLIEADIAKELNVSSIPVREALYILQSSGVVEKIPRKGVRVVLITEDEIFGCVDATMELYRLMLVYSKNKWNEQLTRKLEELLENTKVSLEKKDTLEYLKSCEVLLKFTFEVAGNKPFLRFFSELTNITTAYCQTRWRNFEKVRIWHGDLSNAINCIIQDDFVQAEIEFTSLTKYALEI